MILENRLKECRPEGEVAKGTGESSGEGRWESATAVYPHCDGRVQCYGPVEYCRGRRRGERRREGGSDGGEERKGSSWAAAGEPRTHSSSRAQTAGEKRQGHERKCAEQERLTLDTWGQRARLATKQPLATTPGHLGTHKSLGWRAQAHSALSARGKHARQAG